MKANELMIGDWVLYNNMPHIIHTLTAAGEARYETPNDLTELTYDDCKPIPLTAEILKKNGFWYGLTTEQEDILGCELGVPVTSQKSWVWENDEEAVVWVDFPNEADSGMVWCNNHEKTSSVTWAKGFSVHELQHALRLCGLTKLADNFKI